MKRCFVCLANSKKYGERCIAGIELTKGEMRKYEIVKKEAKPKWIRPVTREAHGAVPSHLVCHIRILDVVELEVTKEVPNGYQCENVEFDMRSIKVIDTIKPLSQSLDKLCDNSLTELFGNEERKVHVDCIHRITHSLVFIKTDYADVVISEFNKDQYRMRFIYHQIYLDLPITDVSFIDYLNRRGETSLEAMGTMLKYITVSLGVEYEKHHYKLVAGVIF